MNDRISSTLLSGQHWEVIKDWLPQDVSVSTLAALDANFQDLGNRYRDLQFVFRVTGPHAAAFQIDHSEDGTFVEDLQSGAALMEVPCASGKQATRRIMDIGELGWRVSAYSTEGGNPSTTVNRRILGRRRS